MDRYDYERRTMENHPSEVNKIAPSSILREAKIAYYARNMFEAGRFFFFVKAT